MTTFTLNTDTHIHARWNASLKLTRATNFDLAYNFGFHPFIFVIKMSQHTNGYVKYHLVLK